MPEPSQTRFDSAPADAATSVPESWKERVIAFGRPGALGIAWLALPPLGGFLLFAYMKTISTWFRSHGDEQGVLMFIGGFIVCAGLGLLPTYAQAILAGYAFGPTLGLGAAFGAALVGFTGAATLGYAVARWISGDRVVRLIESNARATAVRDALVGDRRPLRRFAIVTLLRLPPNSPFAITNLVMAGVRIPLPIFIPATLLGMAPRTFAAVYFGSTLPELVGKPETPKAVFIAGIVLSVIVVAVIGYVAQRALDRLAPQGRASADPTKIG